MSILDAKIREECRMEGDGSPYTPVHLWRFAKWGCLVMQRRPKAEAPTHSWPTFLISFSLAIQTFEDGMFTPWQAQGKSHAAKVPALVWSLHCICLGEVTTLFKALFACIWKQQWFLLQGSPSWGKGVWDLGFVCTISKRFLLRRILMLSKPALGKYLKEERGIKMWVICQDHRRSMKC